MMMVFGIDDDLHFSIQLGGYVPQDYVKSDSVRKIETLTQEEYDALEHPDETTIYIITDA